MMPKLKKKLCSDSIAVGTFVKMPTLSVIDMLGDAGYDFVIIDMEHSPLDFHWVEAMVAAADAVKMSTVIRVPDNQDYLIVKALDLGCDGVQIPMIETVEGAKKAMQAARYYPLGNRSISFATRGARYGAVPRPEHIKESNADQMVVAQIESLSAVEQADSIASLAGIDVLFVGPADLSQSMGMPGQSSDPRVMECLRRVGAAAERNRKALGVHVNRLEDVPEMMACGVTYFVYASDTAFFRRGAQEALQGIRTILKI